MPNTSPLLLVPHLLMLQNSCAVWIPAKKKKKSFEKSKRIWKFLPGFHLYFSGWRRTHLTRANGSYKMDSEWKNEKAPLIRRWLLQVSSVNLPLISVVWCFGAFSISSCSQGWLLQDKYCIITSKASIFPRWKDICVLRQSVCLKWKLDPVEIKGTLRKMWEPNCFNSLWYLNWYQWGCFILITEASKIGTCLHSSFWQI